MLLVVRNLQVPLITIEGVRHEVPPPEYFDVDPYEFDEAYIAFLRTRNEDAMNLDEDQASMHDDEEIIR